MSVSRWKVGAIGGGLLLVAALIPRPTPRLAPDQVWERTQTLAGERPASERQQSGAPYAPIALTIVDYALGTNLAGDPSGAAATREFTFADQKSARAAADEAVRTGIQSGYSMQSAYLGGEAQPRAPGVWGDDGWNQAENMHFVVTLLAPSGHADARDWVVHLLLEHTY